MPPENVEIFAPTLFEFLLTRSVRPRVRVRHAGMRLARLNSEPHHGLVILCGLAGALSTNLRPGDVVIPEESSFAGGEVSALDPVLVEGLRESTRSLGFEPHGGRLLTSSNLVTGDSRDTWAERGFVAADMEAALMNGHSRLGVVRVILDAPDRPITSDWESPARAMMRRQHWREMIWMARYAPIFTLRAARVAAMAASRFAGGPDV